MGGLCICSQDPVQLLVGGKGLPHETRFGPGEECRHLWAKMEPKGTKIGTTSGNSHLWEEEASVDTVTCGRR